mmetsp:Transcript_27117/g.41614  ORF Transcript_27117/g.41614 Transcript_27117/m.41614 type:complete len:761 (+) Transcript_27117:531-2813(+)
MAVRAGQTIHQTAVQTASAVNSVASSQMRNMAAVPGPTNVVVGGTGVGAGGGTNAGGGAQAHGPMAIAAAPTITLATTELDQETKLGLITKYVGSLLDGEQVIMFLSNLLHVSDSTLAQGNMMPVMLPGDGATQNSGTMWCCCMTYYRVALFQATFDEIQNKSFEPNKENDQLPDMFKKHAESGSLSPEAMFYLMNPRVLQMPLASIDKVEKSIYSITLRGAKHPTTLMGLVIHGKENGRQIRFTTSSYGDTIRAHESLQTYAFPGRRNLGYLFAFESRRGEVMASFEYSNVTNGDGSVADVPKTMTSEATRQRYIPTLEFARQGVLHSATDTTSSIGPWYVMTQINSQYQMCGSYPSILLGPLPDQGADNIRLIRNCASFRSEGRLPALTWSSGTDGASIWRCAQPKVGLQGNRNSSDELYIKHIMDAAMAASTSSAPPPDSIPRLPSRAFLQYLTGGLDLFDGGASTCRLKILDMRPKSSAIANRTAGYGYENTSYYPGTTLNFFNIGNIHAVRDSYQKVSALCLSDNTSDVQFAQLVEETKWLSQIRHILSASWQTAFHVQYNRLPVLLHCSHGWDRTSQVAALSQLLIDAYYRTMEGFATLIEKDFMSFGHPFHTRCAHGEGRGEGVSASGDEGQVSPIFLQFLDCVYQLVHMYPQYFEFTEDYLLELSDHVYSCRFGTLLCDTERERELVAGIRQRTYCLWDHLESHPKASRVSRSYNKDYTGMLMMPHSTLMRNVKLWTKRHAMHGPRPIHIMD